MTWYLHKHISRRKEVNIIDRLMLVVCVIHPLMALPQVYQIYATHTALGVSLVTWLAFMLIGLVFLAYGLVHRLKPFIINQAIWFIVDLLIVIGVLLYGKA